MSDLNITEIEDTTDDEDAAQLPPEVEALRAKVSEVFKGSDLQMSKKLSVCGMVFGEIVLEAVNVGQINGRNAIRIASFHGDVITEQVTDAIFSSFVEDTDERAARLAAEAEAAGVGGDK